MCVITMLMYPQTQGECVFNTSYAILRILIPSYAMSY